MKIWIIGGTKDSRNILNEILKIGENDIIISTATEYGGKLLENVAKNKNVHVISEKLNVLQIEEMILEKNIDLIIDASHPYAQNISNTVISMVSYLNERVTQEKKVKYIRFERKMVDYGNKNIFKFQDLQEIIKFLRQFENKTILSTLGSNTLAEIKEVGEKNRLFVRILPTTSSIQNAEELGYLPKNIIAMQGPFSKNMNVVMLQDLKIDYLITKESGETGGELQKVKACQECGVTILAIKRPVLDYGTVFNTIEELMRYLVKL
ncbi:precorrin-6A reductase [Leptotrichia trevisanii]|uniref:Precorrin-6x reductase n=1 Tax=Leptotrichia trevisanii TaxID=109328 RepID=A0A510K3K8_9FUSO|nr:precorrin-6A reductase [Leptotrichia trevisanii]BBM46192.1 precorrin-6x reductase [Leptotrichia trevisanii]